MFGSTLWLAKQVNLVEFVEAADELFWRNQIELWVVGSVPDHLHAKNVRATRFFNRVPMAAIRGGIAGLPLTPWVHYLSFESMRELAHYIERLNSPQMAAYENATPVLIGATAAHSRQCHRASCETACAAYARRPAL